jgi:translation initiation factor IF-2
VQNGTLRLGDIVVAGRAYGKIRAMFDEKGKPVKDAPPSTPVRVMGFDSLPGVGDMFTSYRNEREARAVVDERKSAIAALNTPSVRATLTMEDFFKQHQAGMIKELLLILKADVQGSIEPLVNEINAIPKGNLGLKILLAEAGNITENDINLAISTGAIVIGFSVETDIAAARLAESNNVQIRTYDIIYNVLEDVDKALKGMLDPVYEERIIGKAEVRKVFKISRLGKIAGCMVRDGEIRRNAKVRVQRGRTTVGENLTVGSLKRETEDVREVRAGFECGIGLEGFSDFIPGDIIEFVVTERIS